MLPKLEPCAWCPGCGHCVHEHYVATVRFETLPHAIKPVTALACEECGDVCPSEDDPPTKAAILRRVFVESYKRYLANGL